MNYSIVWYNSLTYFGLSIRSCLRVQSIFCFTDGLLNCAGLWKAHCVGTLDDACADRGKAPSDDRVAKTRGGLDDESHDIMGRAFIRRAHDSPRNAYARGAWPITRFGGVSWWRSFSVPLSLSLSLPSIYRLFLTLSFPSSLSVGVCNAYFYFLYPLPVSTTGH